MKKILPLANGIALIATVIVSYASNRGLFGGNTMATITVKYPSLFTQDVFTFQKERFVKG